jgi:type IV fimbrial biogenesis protein FimT
LAVTATLLFLGIPSARHLINSSERHTKINDIVTALHLARSESMKRGMGVSLCRRASGSTTDCASVDCDSSSHANCWESGWIIFVDKDNIGTREDSEEIIRVFTYDSMLHRLTVTGFTNYISYAPDGTVNTAGSFIYCGDWNGDGDYDDAVDIKNRRSVFINITGRPRLSSS